MQLVDIYQADHTVLRQPARPVPIPVSEEFKQFAKQLTEAMINLNNSVGLAATQIGFPYQMFAMHIPENVIAVRGDVTELLAPTVLINPQYKPLTNEKYLGWEGCFSVPDKMGEVWRYRSIYYEGFTPEGDKITGEAHDLLARIIQHEIGHLNGELFIDLITNECRCGPIDEMRKIRAAELQAK
jgi:peptide deformylase